MVPVAPLSDDQKARQQPDGNPDAGLQIRIYPSFGARHARQVRRNSNYTRRDGRGFRPPGGDRPPRRGDPAAAELADRQGRRDGGSEGSADRARVLRPAPAGAAGPHHAAGTDPDAAGPRDLPPAPPEPARRVSAPRFSILTPVYNTPADVFWAMIRSVRRQSFPDWELCLVDDCSPGPEVAGLLAEAERLDPRIRVEPRAENGGIVAASNDTLAMARGEFLALLDHDDELHPDALAHVHEALLEDPEADYVYTDEDKIDRAGHHSGPFFKPDWSPERMRTQMYTCHLSVFRRSLAEEVGGFHPEFEGS